MIFEDPSHRRWRRAIVVFSLLSVAALSALAITLTGAIIPPHVPNPFSAKSEIQATQVRATLEHDARPVYTAVQKKRMQAIRAQEKRRRDKLVGDPKSVAVPLPQNAVVAFVTQDDPASVASLERHVANIDAVVPDWFTLPGPSCELSERIDDKTRRVLGRSDTIVLPRLANLAGNEWRGAETSRFLANDAARACIIKKVVARLVDLSAEGINLDLEELQPEDSEPFLEFIVELRAALHAKSLRLTVDVPFHDPAFDFEYIGNVADAVMVMAYDQHFPASKPGPIASRTWLSESFDEVLPRLPADRVVVVLGAYGYDWTLADPAPRAEDLGFRAVMDLARATNAAPVFEEQLENGHFGYLDAGGKTHDVWFEDALAIWNQVQTLSKRHVSRVGLWRLGTEDETIWTFLGDDTPETSPAVLGSVPPVKTVALFGDGEVYTIRGEPQGGVRDLTTDKDGHIARAVYSRVPSGVVVEKRGGHGKQVALTFDDGPDERNTGKLLDALKELQVPATFFVIGDQVMRAPDLVRREVQEGHFVGNHSFSHPHMGTLTPREASAELAATERLIEGLTGRRSPLFRAPFTASIDPDAPDDLAALRIALQNGYLFVGANVDSDDWDPTKADFIVDKVIAGITSGEGRIVLMHDGGGDRSRTIAGVRKLVPELRRQGYEFVSLDKMLGVSRTELQATLAPGERLLSTSDAVMAYARGWGWTAMSILFFVCTVLSIVRILFSEASHSKTFVPERRSLRP